MSDIARAAAFAIALIAGVAALSFLKHQYTPNPSSFTDVGFRLEVLVLLSVVVSVAIHEIGKAFQAMTPQRDHEPGFTAEKRLAVNGAILFAALVVSLAIYGVWIALQPILSHVAG